jgi:hypothetical protein
MNAGNDTIWQCFKLYPPSGTLLASVHSPADEQLAIIVQRAKDKGDQFKRMATVADESSW